MYGAPATTNGVGSERQRLLAEVVGESPDPPREPLSRGARVASALVAIAVAGCAVIGTLSLVGAAPLARLGAIGDAGWARELTPEELELKKRNEREAAEATLVAVGNLAGLGQINMPAVGEVKHNLNEVAKKLGSTGECPEAFIRPQVGDKSDWDVSYLASLNLADQVYVICVDCAGLLIPEPIAHKTLLVDGKIYDACDQADNIGLDHYKRASLSHGAAIADALIKQFGKVAIVEDDSTSPDGEHAVTLAPTDLEGFAQAMKQNDWSFFRMGWRQFTLEMDPTLECPQECKCDVRTSKLCFVSNGGCDLRSSDSYIISERYYRWTLDKLINGGTVDYDVLPRAPGVLLTLPILSTQKRLDINIEHQAAVSQLFMERCLIGEVPEEVLGDVKFADEELSEVDKQDTEKNGPHRRVDAKQTHAEKAAAVAAANPDSAGAQRNAERAARMAAEAIAYKSPNGESEDEDVIAVVEGLMSTSDDGSEETESTDAEPLSAAESSDAESETDAEDAVVVPDPAIESILDFDTGPKTTVSEPVYELNAQGAESFDDDAPDSETSEEAAPEADAESNSDSGSDSGSVSDSVSDDGAGESGIQTSGEFIAQTQRR
jgi:hypothetical protein